MNREIKCPRAWDDVLGEMLYSRVEQFDDSLMFRFEKHFETENPVYMWPTGLKDRNGKDIYEGDIVRCGDMPNYEAEVMYDDHFGAWGLCRYQVMSCHVGDYDEQDREVIGNVWEHPYLLGESN